MCVAGFAEYRRKQLIRNSLSFDPHTKLKHSTNDTINYVDGNSDKKRFSSQLKHTYTQRSRTETERKISLLLPLLLLLSGISMRRSNNQIASVQRFHFLILVDIIQT